MFVVSRVQLLGEASDDDSEILQILDLGINYVARVVDRDSILAVRKSQSTWFNCTNYVLEAITHLFTYLSETIPSFETDTTSAPT